MGMQRKSKQNNIRVDETQSVSRFVRHNQQEKQIDATFHKRRRLRH